MHKQGKNKLLKAFNDRPDLVYLMDIFYEANADRDMIANNGYKIISLLYFKKSTGSLKRNHEYGVCFRIESFVDVKKRNATRRRSRPNRISFKFQVYFSS